MAKGKNKKIYKSLSKLTIEQYDLIAKLLYRKKELGKVAEILNVKQCDLIRDLKLMNELNIDSYLYKQYNKELSKSISLETNNAYKFLKQNINKN